MRVSWPAFAKHLENLVERVWDCTDDGLSYSENKTGPKLEKIKKGYIKFLKITV